MPSSSASNVRAESHAASSQCVTAACAIACGRTQSHHSLTACHIASMTVLFSVIKAVSHVCCPQNAVQPRKIQGKAEKIVCCCVSCTHQLLPVNSQADELYTSLTPAVLLKRMCAACKDRATECAGWSSTEKRQGRVHQQLRAAA